MHYYSIQTHLPSYVAAVLCIFFLGCTNIEKNECKKTHWPTQGFEDGKDGRTSRLSMFLAKCLPFNVSVANDEYLLGYEKGLDQFCSEDSAFSRGFQGLSMENVCSNKNKYKISYELGAQSFCSPEFGKEHALEGKPANLFCSSKSKYFSGYQNGLKQFCTTKNGYKFGFSGKNQTTICTDEFKIKFETGFKNGRKVFLKKDIEKIQNNIGLAEKELNLVKDRYTEKLSEAYEIPQSPEDPDLKNKKLKLDTEIKFLKA